MEVDSFISPALVFADRKSLPIAKNHKTSQESSEQVGPSTVNLHTHTKTKGFSKNSHHPNIAKELGKTNSWEYLVRPQWYFLEGITVQIWGHAVV